MVGGVFYSIKSNSLIWFVAFNWIKKNKKIKYFDFFIQLKNKYHLNNQILFENLKDSNWRSAINICI